MTHQAIIEELQQQFRLFIADRRRNLFLEAGPVRTYIRKGYHCVVKEGRPPEAFRTLDIASIDIDKPHRGHGLGSSILIAFHAINPFPMTYVENVLNPDFCRHLHLNGWQRITGSHDSSPSFFKETGQITSPYGLSSD